MILTPEERDAIAERLLAVRAQLKEMEERFHLPVPISEWAALYQEGLSLERQLADQG
jgi:hypothetical protein